jgi:hypothetical protein
MNSRVRWYGRAKQIYAALALLTIALQVSAAERAPLTQGEDIITAPSMGRVVLVFLITSALAVGAIVLLRRHLPKLAGTFVSAGQMKILDRTTLLGGTRVHLIEIGEHTVLVADSRHGVALTVLNKSIDPNQQ